jgi:hypothetical protein
MMRVLSPPLAIVPSLYSSVSLPVFYFKKLDQRVPLTVSKATLVGVALVMGLVGLGFRHYDGTMTLVSTNSLAISAASTRRR